MLQIRVGYSDRFVGIVEEAFSLFDWGDLASAAASALAIPKHRIEYFKVDERFVWRKADRLDDVFGSTGSGRNILDVLSELEEEALREVEEETDAHVPSILQRDKDRETQTVLPSVDVSTFSQ